MEKITKSWEKVLGSEWQQSRASGWQVAYLASLKHAVRFPGLRIFLSLASKRNFDDNNSYLVALPFLFPPFLFDDVGDLEPAGPTLTLLMLARLLMLFRPLHELGFSERQLEMLHECARSCVSSFGVSYLLADFFASIVNIVQLRMTPRLRTVTSSVMSYWRPRPRFACWATSITRTRHGQSVHTCTPSSTLFALRICVHHTLVSSSRCVAFLCAF